MEKECQGRSREKRRGNIPGKRSDGKLKEFSTLEAVQKLAEYNARHIDTEEGLLLFLKSWWSTEFNRPLKDPVLESYSLHELLYEYHDKIERAEASREVFELNTDKIEEEQEQETLDWIEREEREERESQAKLEVEQKAKADDEEWMLQQLKKEHGDDFGEDISANFEE